MRLPRVLASGLLVCVMPTIHAATFALGNSGTLRIDIPPSWTATGQRLGDHGIDLRFHPSDSVGPQVCFTIIVPPKGEALERTAAGSLLRDVVRQNTTGSTDAETAIIEKDLTDGFAFYTSIPTNTTAGQPPDAESWKSSTPCVMVLGGQVVISATIFSDDTAAPEFAKSLDVLWSTRFEPNP